MNNLKLSVSVCRHCGRYQLEGQRGGYCLLLDVPVRGCWKACSLCISPFEQNSKHLELRAIASLTKN